MPVRVPPVPDGSEAEEALAAAFRLRGLTLSDARVVELTDAALGADRAGASSVVYGLRRRKDGTLAGAVDAPEFDALLAAARKKAAAALESMLEGVAAASPAEGACAYCPHRSVCRFDPRLPACRTRRRRSLSQQAFFEELKGK